MMFLSTLPWQLAPHLPWQLFTSPAEKWSVQPSFVIGEYLFIGLALLALWHARSQSADPQNNQRKKHLLVWVGALLAGTANDIIFMALPLVDNFFQAQATIMLTPRLPLYIPCVYVCFMYFPTVAAWRTRLPPLARAMLSGLAGSLFYAPYDIVGAKFLWWTWHDTDMPIANRLLGAPIGSTMWVITFVAAFAWLCHRALAKDGSVRPRTFAKGLAMMAGLSTLLMMVQMTALQQLDGGVPGLIGLCVVAGLYGGWSLWSARKGGQPLSADPRRDGILFGAVAVYFTTLALIMAVFDPASHRSASLHQTYGPCGVVAKDITGNTRFKFICAAHYDEDFTFACAPLPKDGDDWYTVCGRPHTDFPRWMGGTATLGVVGIALFGWLLRRRKTVRGGESRPRPSSGE